MTFGYKSLIFGFGLLAAAPVFASTISVDFGKPDEPAFVQSTSTSATYTFAPNLTITATGYHINGTPQTTALYAKTNGGDEEGLGLANEAGDHEITNGNFIQLDLSKIGANSSFSLFTDSTTGSDAFKIYVSAIKGVEGTLSATGNTETTYSFTAAQIAAAPYISLAATSGDVLLGPGAVTSNAPEPGTVLSLGAGMLLVTWRARKAAKR